VHKAHYILMNVEATLAAVEELATNFRYNDAVLRNMIIQRDEAVLDESPIMKAEKESRERRGRGDRRDDGEGRRSDNVDELEEDTDEAAEESEE
jgi:small subunit ribosomal protein S6